MNNLKKHTVKEPQQGSHHILEQAMKFQDLDREERKWRKILKHKRQCDRGESSEIGRFDGQLNPS